MVKGDIVKNHSSMEESLLYQYQVVISTFGGKGAMTIDYSGNTHRYDNATDHMEVVGHMAEYDAYMQALKKLEHYEER